MNVTMMCSWLGLALAAGIGQPAQQGGSVGFGGAQSSQGSGVEPFKVKSGGSGTGGGSLWSQSSKGKGTTVSPFGGQSGAGRWNYTKSDSPLLQYSGLGSAVVVRTGGEGEVRYWVHGQEVEGENVQSRAGKVLLLGEDGGQLLELDSTEDGVLVVPNNSTLTIASLPEKPRPAIGVRVAPLEPVLQRQLSLSADEGVVITEVLDGKPAAEAGIETYDIVLRVDGEPVTVKSLPLILSRQSIGDSVRVRVLRGAEVQEVDVKVGEADPMPSTGFFYNTQTGQTLLDGTTGRVIDTGGISQGIYTLQSGDAPFVDSSGRYFLGSQSKNKDDKNKGKAKSEGDGTSGGVRFGAGAGGGTPSLGGSSGASTGSQEELDELNAELTRLRATLEALEKALDRMERDK